MEALSLNWLIIAAVTLFAALAQSATGFGFAIIAVPLYLLVLNSNAAVQLAIVVTPVISLALLWRMGRHVDKPLLLRLVAGTALGLPPGMAAFHYANLTQLKLAVALLIVLFALVFLAGILRGRSNNPGSGKAPSAMGDLITGLVSGAMTSSLGMPGPPVVMYFSRLGLEKNTTRATLLTLFLFSYAGGIAMQAAVAGLSPEIWKLAATLVPFVIAGSIGGHFISGRMSQDMFRAATLLLLLATGLYMLFATLRWF